MNTAVPKFVTIGASVSLEQKRMFEQFAASRGLSESEILKRALALYTSETVVAIAQREGVDEAEALRRALAEYTGDKEAKLNHLLAERLIRAELLADRILFYLTTRDGQQNAYAATLTAISHKVRELLPGVGADHEASIGEEQSSD